MHRINLPWVVTAVCALLCLGCAPIEYADEVSAESAKSFSVDDGMALIYVFRDDNVVLNTPISVAVDGAEIGVTGNGTFVMATVEPGPHLVTAKGENTDELSVDTDGGEIVFIEIGVGLGAFTNRANLILVEPDRGREAVLNTRFVQ